MQSQEQVIAKLKGMAKKADVIRNISDKIVDGKISAYFYGKLKGVGIVGSITGTVPADLDVTTLEVGGTFVITITSRSPFVDKDGNAHKIQLGNTVSITR